VKGELGFGLSPQEASSLGVLHMGKFAMALRLRWPWLEWKDPTKIWIGSGNPCTTDDMEIFYAATTTMVDNGKKTTFWYEPWLGGRKPIEVAPLIFSSSKRKNWKIAQALHGNAWVDKVDLEQDFTMENLSQFVELWVVIYSFQLNEDVEDAIV
jgi:hypothetical protein